jgi:hypothetical protein
MDENNILATVASQLEADGMIKQEYHFIYRASMCHPQF